MARIVLLQFVVAVLIAALAVFIGDLDSGISSLLGGLSFVIPNALFMLGLHVSERKLQTGTLGPFYFWELVKILLTIALAAAVFWIYREVRWLAYSINFVVALKSYVLLLSRFKKY